MILTKEHTPAPDALGAANGIGEFLQMIGSGVGSTFIRFVARSSLHSFGPDALTSVVDDSSSLFAFSMSLDGLGGLLWIVVIVALSAMVSSQTGHHMKKDGSDFIRLD